MLYETDNPDRTDIDWQQPLRTGRNGAYKVFRASVAPRVTLLDHNYEQLVNIHNVFRVRNIPLDSLFKGGKCDIIVKQYDRNDETLLQLGELVFQSVASLNLNGE